MWEQGKTAPSSFYASPKRAGYRTQPPIRMLARRWSMFRPIVPQFRGFSCSFTSTHIIVSRPVMPSAARPQPMPVSPNVAVGPGTAAEYKPAYASYSVQWPEFAMRVNRQRMMGLPRGL